MRRALILLALVPVAAGCGTGDTFSADPVANAATKTAKASSVRMDMTMTIRSEALPEAVTSTASGIMDNRAKRGRMTLDMSSFAKAGGGALGGPDAWRGEQILDTSHGRLVAYMRIPAFTRALHASKPWIKFDFQKLGERLGIDFQQLMQLGQGNPAQSVDYLRAVSGKIEERGHEQVRGVGTTRYHATIDLAKYPDLVPANRRAQMQKTIDSLIELAGVRTIPADVWIGEDQLVRKMTFNYTMRVKDQATGERRSTEMDMTIVLYDFGAVANIQLPPASKVADLTKLIEETQ